MFIFKRLHPQGGDRAAAPPRSCKSKTLRGDAELGEIASKPPSPSSTHQPQPLISFTALSCFSPTHRTFDTIYPPTKIQTRARESFLASARHAKKLLGHHGNEELCALPFIVSHVTNLLKPIRKFLHQAPAHLAQQTGQLSAGLKAVVVDIR